MGVCLAEPQTKVKERGGIFGEGIGNYPLYIHIVITHNGKGLTDSYWRARTNELERHVRDVARRSKG